MHAHHVFMQLSVSRYTQLSKANSCSAALKDKQHHCYIAMSRLTQEFIDAFSALMKDELKMTANEFHLKGMQILADFKLLRVAKEVHPKYLMPHKENRKS